MVDLSGEAVIYWDGVYENGDPSNPDEMAGWYIASYDVYGEWYDHIGPYDTRDDARLCVYETATDEYGGLL